MLDKIRQFFKNSKQKLGDERCLIVPKSEVNEELKSNIIELERLAEQWGKVLQRKYAIAFENKGKLNLRIWVCRDIDGDELEELSSENCLEKEYRSQILIDFDDDTVEDDEYADIIQLWYYYGGGTGTIYDITKNNLVKDIELGLETLLN
ncbi:hypothetical protein ACQKGI_21865 [Peribacillus muralis]|uniref:hypothetical protein n=1 Tax=Peribacillus muralis TaxID=264697 RepID=UPI0038187C07